MARAGDARDHPEGLAPGEWPGRPGVQLAAVERPETATAVIIDDWPLIRLGITQALRGSGVAVVGALPGVEEGLRLAQARGAGAVVLGGLRDMTLPDAVRRAKDLPGPPKVVALIDHIDAPALTALRAAGVDGLLGRSAAPDELAAALRRVVAGERVVSPTLLPMLIGVLGPGAQVRRGPDGAVVLTRKEVEVLSRLSAGGSNQEIADALFVTAATVKTHLAHIYAKLGVTTRQEAMARAVAIGLLG